MSKESLIVDSNQDNQRIRNKNEKLSFNNNLINDFNTTSDSNDIKIMELIEDKLSITIPELELIQHNKLGYKLKNGFVTELSIFSIRCDKVFDIICSLSKLEKLLLNKTNITTISFSIHKLRNLIYLDLKNNSINYIPKELLQLPCLKYLDLSFNNLKTFKTFKNDLPSLEIIILDHNDLEEVNFSANSCNNLLECHLNNNKLFHVDVDNLKSLRYLALQNNKLCCLPKIGFLSNLETLEMHYNDLTEVTTDFTNLRSLGHMSLSYNKIFNIKFDTLNQKSIKYLFLNGNPLNKQSIHDYKSFLNHTRLKDRKY